MSIAESFPKHWKIVSLDSVVIRLTNGYVGPTREIYVPQGIPYLLARHVKNNRLTFDEKTFVSPEFNQKHNKSILKEGDVLMVQSGHIGETAVVPKNHEGHNCHAMIIITPKSEKLLGHYLSYFFHSKLGRSQLDQLETGITLQHLNCRDVKDVEIPLPPLEEQKRIASIAQKCDRLRRTRRYTQQLSDGYLQSVFLQMFGGEESEKWELVKVEDVAKSGKNTIRTGPFGSQLLHEEFQLEGDIAVLGIDNVVQNFFTWDKKRFITEKKYQELKRYRVFPGDVLITIMGTCGRCVVVPKNIPLAINTKHLCCVTLDQEHCLPTYLQHFFLRHPLALRQLGISERGAVMPGLNMGLIKDLVMPLPPLPLQEKFAQIVQRFERLRMQQREADPTGRAFISNRPASRLPG